MTEPDRYLRATQLLDYRYWALEELVTDRGWKQLPAFDQIARIYDFVQNEIAFGYNQADDIAASRFLADGYGQCNTKGTLLMALLRSCGIPCRFQSAGATQLLIPFVADSASRILGKRSALVAYFD